MVTQILESQVISKGSKQEIQNRLKLRMPEGNLALALIN